MDIYNIIPRFIIAPGYSEKWYGDTSKLMVVEAEDSIILKHSNGEYLLSNGLIGIGNAISVTNNRLNPICLKIVVFSSINKQEAASPIILSKTDSNAEPFMDSLHKVFEQTSYDSKTVTSLCQNFSNLMGSFAPPITQNSNQLLKGKIDPRLIWIHRMIRKEYQRPLTLDIFAQRVKCNPVYLSNTYSKVFKCSPMKHLQRVRINKACQLLEETNMPINEIMQSVGYVSRSQFSDYFKKYYGVNPSDYRRNMLFRKDKVDSWQ